MGELIFVNIRTHLHHLTYIDMAHALDTIDNYVYYPVMNKSFFSAFDLFDALDAKARRLRMKVTLTSISKETEISTYKLRKLKQGIAEHIANHEVDALFAFSQSVGLKIAQDQIVKITLVQVQR